MHSNLADVNRAFADVLKAKHDGRLGLNLVYGVLPGAHGDERIVSDTILVRKACRGRRGRP